VIHKGVIGAVAGGIAVIGIFVFLTNSGMLQRPLEQEGIGKDVVLNLNSVNVVSVDEDSAIIEVSFDAFNPNKRSVVLEAVLYTLYANGVRLATDEIGQRTEGFITGTGRTFTMYGEYSMPLNDKVEVARTEFVESVWSDLQNNNVQWHVTGKFWFTDPVRAGGEERDFDFVV